MLSTMDENKSIYYWNNYMTSTVSLLNFVWFFCGTT